MPSLKFRDALEVIKAAGFQHVRTKGSHAHYEAVIGGLRRLVTIQTNHPNADIDKGTLGSIIRQSGLPKKLFRK